MTAARVGQRRDDGMRVRAVAAERVCEDQLPAIECGPAGGRVRRALWPVDDLVHQAHEGVNRVHGRPDLGWQPARGPIVGGIVAAMDAPAVAVELPENRVGGSRHMYACLCPDGSPVCGRNSLACSARLVWAVPGSNGRPPACKARPPAVRSRMWLRRPRSDGLAPICCGLSQFVASRLLPRASDEM